jgi:hypothetical protein
LADFFVQLSIIPSPPNGVKSPLAFATSIREEFGAVVSVPALYTLQFQKLGHVEESTTHDTAKLCPVIGRASLVPRLVRNRGTG